MALPPANHYLATFNDGDSTKSVEVFAKDETQAISKVLMLFPNATSITIASKKCLETRLSYIMAMMVSVG